MANQPLLVTLAAALDAIFCLRAGRVFPFEPIVSFPFPERLSPFPILLSCFYRSKNKTEEKNDQEKTKLFLSNGILRGVVF